MAKKVAYAFDAVEDPEGGPESVDFSTMASSKKEAEAHFVLFRYSDEPASLDAEERRDAQRAYREKGYRVRWHATMDDMVRATDLPRFAAAKKKLKARR